jgi:hypothetical protein
VELTDMQTSIILSSAKVIGTEVVKRIAAHPDVRRAGLTEAKLLEIAGITEMTVSKKAPGAAGSRSRTFDAECDLPYPQLSCFPYIPNITWPGRCHSIVSSNGQLLCQCLNPIDERSTDNLCTKHMDPESQVVAKHGTIQDRHDMYNAKRRAGATENDALAYEHRNGNTKTSGKQYTLATHLPELARKMKISEAEVIKLYHAEAARLSRVLGKDIKIPEHEFTAVVKGSRSGNVSASRSTTTATLSPGDLEEAITTIGNMDDLARQLADGNPKGAKLATVYTAFRKVYLQGEKRETIVANQRAQMLARINSLREEAAHTERTVATATRRSPSTRATPQAPPPAPTRPATRTSTRPPSTTSTTSTTSAATAKPKPKLWQIKALGQIVHVRWDEDIQRAVYHDGMQAGLIVPANAFKFKAVDGKLVRLTPEELEAWREADEEECVKLQAADMAYEATEEGQRERRAREAIWARQDKAFAEEKARMVERLAEMEREGRIQPKMAPRMSPEREAAAIAAMEAAEAAEDARVPVAVGEEELDWDTQDVAVPIGGADDDEEEDKEGGSGTGSGEQDVDADGEELDFGGEEEE